MIRLVSIHGNDKDCLQWSQRLHWQWLSLSIYTVITFKSVCTVGTVITSVCLDIEDCFCRCFRVRASTIPYKCKQSYIMHWLVGQLWWVIPSLFIQCQKFTNGNDGLLLYFLFSNRIFWYWSFLWISFFSSPGTDDDDDDDDDDDEDDDDEVMLSVLRCQLTY